MQNPFLYNGSVPNSPNNHSWKPLRAALNNTGTALVAPETFTIPTGGRTEIIAVHDCLEAAFMIEAAQAGQIAAGSNILTIERCRTQSVSLSADINPYIQISPTAAWTVVSQNLGQMLGGWFRVSNNTGSNVYVFVQKRIN